MLLEEKCITGVTRIIPGLAALVISVGKLSNATSQIVRVVKELNTQSVVCMGVSGWLCTRPSSTLGP